jgi:hypothetical protein
MTKNIQTAADEPQFPPPDYYGRNRYWKLSDLLKYEAACRGEAHQGLAETEDCYLTASQVRKRFGGVSDMWLWRRLNQRSEAEAARPHHGPGNTKPRRAGRGSRMCSLKGS